MPVRTPEELDSIHLDAGSSHNMVIALPDVPNLVPLVDDLQIRESSLQRYRRGEINAMSRHRRLHHRPRQNLLLWCIQPGYRHIPFQSHFQTARRYD